MIEEPDMINTTLNNGSSLRQLIIGVSCSLYFKLLEKAKNMLNSDKHYIKICFMLVPVSGSDIC